MVNIERLQYIEIGLNQERYALKIEVIQEIIKMQSITEISSSNHFVMGVINLRGGIVPILHLKLKFNMLATEPNRDTRMVIVKIKEAKVGLIVDQVFSVVTFDEVQHQPDGVRAIDRGFVTGVGRSGDNLVSILNIDAVLYGGILNG